MGNKRGCKRGHYNTKKTKLFLKAVELVKKEGCRIGTAMRIVGLSDGGGNFKKMRRLLNKNVR